MFGGINHMFNDLVPPFIKTIKEANLLSLMVFYANVYRVPMSVDTWMLQTLLRRIIGYHGLIMSDAEAMINLHMELQVAKSPWDAGSEALKVGLQMKFSPAQPAVIPTLIGAVNETQVAALVDDAILQMLAIKFATGVFDRPCANSRPP